MQRILLFFVLCLLCFVESYGAESHKTNLNKVKKELEVRKKEKKKLERKEKSILGNLQGIDRKILSSNKKVKKLKTKETIFKDLIKTLDLRREEIGSRLEEQKNLAGKKLTFVYQYGISNQLPLTNSNRARTIFYLEEVLKEDANQHKELFKLKTNVTTKEEEQEQGLSKLLEVKTKAEKEQRKIFSQQRKKRQILKSVRKEKKKKAILIVELEKSYAKLEKLIAGVKKYPASEFGSANWPVRGKIVGKFGTVVDPKLGTKLRNKGIDIKAPYGTAVVAVNSGEVVHEGAFLGYGEVILLDHQNGFCSLYAHLSETLVVEGDKIRKGEIIGKVGSTGLVDVPLLHFEIRKGGVAVDPLKWLK